MFEKRTDLALEAHEICIDSKKDDGIITKTEIINGFEVTSLEILSEKGAETAGKGKGKYINADIGSRWKDDPLYMDRAVMTASELIKRLLPENAFERGIFVAGLGNCEITADSVGPKTVRKVKVTRHIEKLDRELFEKAGFVPVSAAAFGVFAQTGIESAETVKSIVSFVSPACVIAVDALASRRLSRLASTLQISDAGISPGSGVFNSRCSLNKKFLGVPVISLGVPTVVDAFTLACDIAEENGMISKDGSFEKIFKDLSGRFGRDIFVSPKDIDVIAEKVSTLLARAINLSLHGTLSPEYSDIIF